MGINGTKLLFSKVMHKRLTPRINQFVYGVFYVIAPLSKLSSLNRGRLFGVNRLGLLSLYEKDYGPRDGGNLHAWIKQTLAHHNVTSADGEIYLITMPRFLGYAFNPVSFWLCYDKEQALRAVLCEVNNTFKEHHFYLCHHEDQRAIEKDDWLEAEKIFHVSPFIKRDGHYKFRFAINDQKVGIWIDLFDAQAQKKLLTSVIGDNQNLDETTIWRAFFRYPFETIKVVWLIHWQALKIVTKRISYIPKPPQKEENFTTSEKITKN